MEPLLSADSLVKRYGDIVAVNHISFEINRGEIFSLLGPNGAGKTTTVKMMCGLLKPDSGTVTIASNNDGRSVGFCPQHIVIWENLTVLEQIVFMGQMHNMPVREARGKSQDLLESLGLIDVKDRHARKLSGGMQRRLNIALALIHSPEILFLDEPQAGLDPQSRILVRDYLRTIKKNTTIVLTTHDMEEAEKLSDRITIIDTGRLLVSGTETEIKQKSGFEDVIELDIKIDFHKSLLAHIHPDLADHMTISDNRILFSARDPMAALTKIVEVVNEQRIPVENLRLRKTSLEDIFINLTGRSLRE